MDFIDKALAIYANLLALNKWNYEKSTHSAKEKFFKSKNEMIHNNRVDIL